MANILRFEIIHITPVIEKCFNLYGNYRIPIVERDHFEDGTHQDINRGKYFYVKREAEKWLAKQRRI